MTWNDVLTTLQRVADYKLMDIGGAALTPGNIAAALLIMLVTLLLSGLTRRGIQRVFRRRHVEDAGTAAAVNRLVHYVFLLVGVGVALQTAGFNLTALFAAGAVFAVGLGFAMKNIVENFVAGVILLVERSIKPGDVLEAQGVVVKVEAMGIRTTIVQSRDGDHLIVPNSVLAQSTVKNYTLKKAAYRVRATVGVVYGADMAQVRQTLERVAREIPDRMTDREPQVMMLQFGNNSVDFEVAVWFADPWLSRPALSRLNEAIWWALKEQGVTIAFPQVDVHFDPPVAEGLARLSAVG